MSAVRMCDKCGGVFSELADGWQAYTAATLKRDENGRRISVMQNLDACPACAVAVPGTDAPPMLVNPGASQDPKFFERAALEQENEKLKEDLAAARGESKPPPVEPEPAAA